MKPFGPVDNGSQAIYGLDYKTAMCRDSEENPFHTKVGYWLWDGATGEVLRGFVVPRGITVLAGRHRSTRCDLVHHERCHRQRAGTRSARTATSHSAPARVTTTSPSR